MHMKQNEPQWPKGIPGALILPDQIHVWSTFLDIGEPQRMYLENLLSTDEIARAERFRFERDRKRFIVARGRLRQILGHYLDKPPGKIRFSYTAYGKPTLPGQDPLHFNLSHSGAFALYAVTLERNIGIDIERINSEAAAGEVVRNFFSPGEIKSFQKAPLPQRIELFFKYWTRKEAQLKATGKGLSFALEKFDISGINGADWSRLTWPGDQNQQSNWYLQDLFPSSGYAAAVVVEGSECQLQCRHYSG